MAGMSIITPGRSEAIMRMLKMAMIGAVLIAVSSARVGGGQMPTSSLSWTNQMPGVSQPDTMRRAEQKRLMMSERQKRLVEDTDKLLKLTTALKEQVDESNKDILSVDMIKKAEEIEKLAHSVKERIKG
jgi:hypothetical protein